MEWLVTTANRLTSNTDSGECIYTRSKSNKDIELHYDRNCRHQTNNNNHSNAVTSVSFHTLAGHAIDDAVAARIHVPDGVGCKPHTKSKPETGPQDDVEYNRIVFGIPWSTIQRILQKRATASAHEINCYTTNN